MTSSEDADGRGPNSFRRLSTELGQFWSLGGRLASFSVRHAGPVVVAGLLLGVVSAWFAATHFAMSTDTDQLISRTLPWRLNNAAFNKVFPFPARSWWWSTRRRRSWPSRPPRAHRSAAEPAEAVPAVLRPDGGPFWRQNGLLFASTADVTTRWRS